MKKFFSLVTLSLSLVWSAYAASPVAGSPLSAKSVKTEALTHKHSLPADKQALIDAYQSAIARETPKAKKATQATITLNFTEMADRFYDEEDNAFVFFVQNESCEVGIYISNANGLDGYHGADECEAFIDKYVGEDIEEIDGESVTATVSTISGKTTISADIVGSDNNLYKITLFYQLPTPEDTVNITLSLPLSIIV